MFLFRKAKDITEGIGRQINPFDGGATFNNRTPPRTTNMANLATTAKATVTGARNQINPPPAQSRFNFTTPDQQQNYLPYPDITRGLTFGGSGRPDLYRNPVQMPQIRTLGPSPTQTLFEDGSSGLVAPRYNPGRMSGQPGYIGDTEINTGVKGRKFYRGNYPVQLIDPSKKKNIRATVI